MWCVIVFHVILCDHTLYYVMKFIFTFAPVNWFTKHGNPEAGSACIIHPTGVSLIGLTFVFRGGVLSFGSYSSSNSANGDELWLWLPELIVPALLCPLILSSYIHSKIKIMKNI